MRYSPNLAVIVKALDKVSGRLARDFGEIENLQNNPASAIKFANSCYQKIAKNIGDDLQNIHPDYGLEFPDGSKIGNPHSEYNYIILPIDGMVNLSRALPIFTTIIALEYNHNNKKEVIAAVINNVVNNELYWCEKGSGAFLNNRRIRVSNRNINENILCSISHKELLQNPLVNNSKFTFHLNNCPSLNIAYLAAGRLDLCYFDNSDTWLLKAISLLLKEAGGSLINKDQLIIASNSKINF